jgi:hypothetical protein
MIRYAAASMFAAHDSMILPGDNIPVAYASKGGFWVLTGFCGFDAD